MSSPATIAKILKCNMETAEQIADTMYQWISPDWSEQSTASLRMDLKIAAELEGINIVKAEKCTPAQLKFQSATNADQMRAMLQKVVTTGYPVNGYSAKELVARIAKFDALAA